MKKIAFLLSIALIGSTPLMGSNFHWKAPYEKDDQSTLNKQMDTWICTFCHFTNQANTNSCQICKNSKPTSLSIETSSTTSQISSMTSQQPNTQSDLIKSYFQASLDRISQFAQQLRLMNQAPQTTSTASTESKESKTKVDSNGDVDTKPYKSIKLTLENQQQYTSWQRLMLCLLRELGNLNDLNAGGQWVVNSCTPDTSCQTPDQGPSAPTIVQESNNGKTLVTLHFYKQEEYEHFMQRAQVYFDRYSKLIESNSSQAWLNTFNTTIGADVEFLRLLGTFLNKKIPQQFIAPQNLQGNSTEMLNTTYVFSREKYEKFINVVQSQRIDSFTSKATYNSIECISWLRGLLLSEQSVIFLTDTTCTVCYYTIEQYDTLLKILEQMAPW